MKKILLPFIFVLSLTYSFAQPSPPTNLSGTDLRTWLKDNWFSGYHQQLGYNKAREFMYGYIDEREDGKVYCVYSGFSQPAATTTYLNPINCEHTVPQSFFGSVEPMKSDIHHLFPTHGSPNSTRSNHPFNEIDDTKTTSWLGVSENGAYTTSASIPTQNIDVYSEYFSSQFEPMENHKGDVARAVFYYYTMYPNTAGEITSMVVNGNLEILYQWHLNDPVSDWERQRNDRVAEKQGNRNPFIDYPAIACKAWGLTCAEENQTIVLTAALEPFEKTMVGTSSAEQQYSVEATDLQEDLVITSSGHFQIGLSTEEAAFQQQITLTPAAGIINPTTVYVRFTPQTAVNGPVSGTVTHSSGEQKAVLAVSGEEGDPNVQEVVLLEENFNDCSFEQRGWEIISLSSNKDWSCQGFGVENSSAPEMNGYGGDTGSKDYLLSPVVDLTTASQPVVGFWTRSYYAGSGQKIKLLVSTDYTTTVEQANWTELSVTLPEAGSQVWTESLVDLSQFSGEQARIAFYYEAADNYPSWTVDDVKITDTETRFTGYTLSFAFADSTISAANTIIDVPLSLNAPAEASFTTKVKVTSNSFSAGDVSFSPAANAAGEIELAFEAGETRDTIQIEVNRSTAATESALSLQTVLNEWVQNEANFQLRAVAQSKPSSYTLRFAFSDTTFTEENVTIDLPISIDRAAEAPVYVNMGIKSMRNFASVNFIPAVQDGKIKVLFEAGDTEKMLRINLGRTNMTEEATLMLSSEISEDLANEQSLQLTGAVSALPTGVQEAVRESLVVYPNPIKNGRLFIKMDLSEAAAVSIKLFGTSGKLVYEGAYQQDGIDVGHLPSGLYNLQLVQNGRVINKRIIKQ